MPDAGLALDLAAEPGISRRAVERVAAALLVGFAALVLWDSLGRGAGWAFNGSQSGYFPARVGLLMLGAAGAALWSSLQAD